MKKVFYAFLSFMFLPTLFSCSSAPQGVSKEIYAFSTLINITAYDCDETYVNAAAQILETYNKLADNFLSYSGCINVNDINNAPKETPVAISDELLNLLIFSEKMMAATDGYFDPYLGTITSLYKEAIESETAPNMEQIAELLKERQNGQVTIDNVNKTVTLSGDISIDLGAIAKGYALNKVKEYFAGNNITHYIVNGGLSSIVLGEKPNDENGYSVGVKGLDDYVVYLKNVSLATSSISEQSFSIDGELYTHIINPFTGSSKPLYSLVLLKGNDAGMLDAFSTAFMNMSEEMIVTKAEEYGFSYLVSKDGSNIYIRSADL